MTAARSWLKSHPGHVALEREGDAEFEAAHEEAIARLHAAASVEEARKLYRDHAFPREVERVRRAAGRSGEAEAPFDLLFVTVGGQAYSPLLATVATPAKFVVLVHTKDEKAPAEEVVQRLELDAASASLEEIGDGKDPVLLYERIYRVYRQRGQPARVAFDLTGGLKTMSAAAASAAFALPGAQAFYIDAEQPKIQGSPFWIRERRLALENPYVVFGQLRRTNAQSLLSQGHYAAAAEVFRALHHDLGEARDRCRCLLADGYAALESLDFSTATEKLSELSTTALPVLARSREASGDPLVGCAEQIKANLAGARALATVVAAPEKGRNPTDSEAVLRSDGCRDLVAYLIASAKRREAHGERDVAALLAYRALEAICQRRLALLGGVDPAKFDWPKFAAAANLTLEELVDKYNEATKKPEYRLSTDQLPGGVARTVAYTLLHVAFADDVARDQSPARFGGIGESRNRSVLAHGLQKLSEKATQALLEQANQFVERLLEVESVQEDERQALLARHRFVETT